MNSEDITVRMSELNNSDRSKRVQDFWGDNQQLESEMFGSTLSVLSASNEQADSELNVGSRISPKTRNLKPHSNEKNQGGDFTLQNIIGHGGTSLIYEAQQNGLNRSVAVKMHESGKESERFFVEAGIIALLEHPNIVPIYEAGTNEDNTQFFAMRKISGVSWRQKIDKLSLQENIDILLHVINAINHAHSRNILHCDIKPENIMVGSFGEVSLIDWGLSMFHSDNGAIPTSKDGVIGGTPPYMAPEQALIISEEIGKHTDTYLLCGLLFRICTGQAPHPGSTNRECISNAAQNLLNDHDPNDPLTKIAIKGLSEEPHNRFQNAHEVRNAILAWKNQVVINTLIKNAQEHFSQAQKGAYEHFAKALFLAEEANEKIEDPEQKHNELIIDIRNKYALTSIEREDFQLAKQILQDNCDPAIQLKLDKAIQLSNKRTRRTKQLRMSIFGMLLFILFVSISGAIYASLKQRETKSSLQITISENEKAEERTLQQMYAAAKAEIDEERFIAGRYKLLGIPESKRNQIWDELYQRTHMKWKEIQLAKGTVPKRLVMDDNERYLVCNYSKRSLGVYDLKTLERLTLSLESGHNILHFDIDPEGKHVIYMDNENIKVIEIETNKIVSDFKQAHHSKIEAIGKHLYLTDRNDSICCFNFLSGEQVWETPLHHKKCASDFINYSNGHLILREHQLLFDLQISDYENPRLLSDRPGKASYLAGATKGTDLYYFYTYPNGSCQLTSERPIPHNTFNLRSRPDCATIDLNSNMLAFASYKMREVHVKSINSKTEPHIYHTPAPPLAIQFIEQGNRLIVGVQDQLIILDLSL